MHCEFRKPHPQLSPWVSQLWYFQGVDPAAARERLVPSGRMQLLINLDDDRLSYRTGTAFEHLHSLPGTMVSGLFERAIAINAREQRAIAGVVLQPLTAHQWFGLSQAHLIREFKELVGVTPGSYRSRNPRDRNHIPLLSENTRS